MPGLDANLFDDHDHVHPVVRERLIDTLTTFLAATFSSPGSWTCAYLTGFGASSQWDGKEEGKRGECDVRVTVDWGTFYPHQGTDIKQMTRRSITNITNYLMRVNLWPTISDVEFGDGLYEVTYEIHAPEDPAELLSPYAAYDLNAQRWVTP